MGNTEREVGDRVRGRDIEREEGDGIYKDVNMCVVHFRFEWRQDTSLECISYDLIIERNFRNDSKILVTRLVWTHILLR